MEKEDMIKEGYELPILINGSWCALMRMAFTTGLIVDIDEIGYSHRFCYEHYYEAKQALENYQDTEIFPDGNWIKRKGLNGDFTNPNYER